MKKRVLLGMMSLITVMSMSTQAMAYEEDTALNAEYPEVSEGENMNADDLGEEEYSEDFDEETDLEVSGEGETSDTEAEEESYIYDETNVTAGKVAASELKISGPYLAAAGKTYTYSVSVLPANASKAVSWKVEPADAGVKIDAKGKLIVDAACTLEKCTVTATSNKNTDVNDSFEVNINPGFIKTMNIYEEGKLVNGTTLTIFRVGGDETKYRTNILPEVRLTSSTGKEFVHTPYKITNNREDLVTVGEDGTITAVGNSIGTATITYTAIDGSKVNGKVISKSIKVRVANPVTEIQLRLPANRSKYVVKGKTITLTPSLKADYGAPWTTGLIYTSSNPTVATVNTKGVVTVKADSYSPVTITATAKDGSGTSSSIDLIACNAVKNISMGNFPYTKAGTNQVMKVSLSGGKKVLPVIYNEPEGGNAKVKCTCPDIEVTSSQPKYLEASYEDGYITLNPLNVYATKNIVISVKMLDGSGTVKKWNFRVTE